MKRYVLLLLVLAVSRLSAQIKVGVDVPDVVAVGDKFRIEYSVNSVDVEKISPPVFTGFDELYGPSTSSMQSVEYNGRNRVSVSKTIFTYTLMATKAGNYSIPGATIYVGGKGYKTKPSKLKVIAGSGQSGGSEKSRQPSARRTSRSENLSEKDLFITVTANKTNVYEQEAVLLTYKVFTRINLTRLSGKMPDLKGFLVQEIELPNEKNFSVENYNGEIYRSCVWSQYVLFPQQAGKLVIPSIVYEGVVVVPDPSIDPLDAFFNGSSGGFEKRKDIKSPSLTIEVSPLPVNGRPANFSQAVGSLSIDANAIGGQPKTGNAMTLRVTLTGKGNMKLLKTPEVKFPSDFETYEPKSNGKTQITKEGMVGTMTFDYLVVPRKEGRATIPPIEYSYFDTETKAYKRISTKAMVLNIQKGKDNNYSASERAGIDMLNQDIRYIKLGKSHLTKSTDTFWNSPLYWSMNLGLLTLFVAMVLFLRNRIRENSDIIKMRGKGANKLVTKRMRKAAKLLSEAKQTEFYDEIMRALMGYIGDRFQIPIAELSKDNMFSTLINKGISEETANTFIKALEDCEFARFAPGNPSDTMDSILLQATNAINEMEQVIRRKQR